MTTSTLISTLSCTRFYCNNLILIFLLRNIKIFDDFRSDLIVQFSALSSSLSPPVVHKDLPGLTGEVTADLPRDGGQVQSPLL